MKPARQSSPFPTGPHLQRVWVDLWQRPPTVLLSMRPSGRLVPSRTEQVVARSAVAGLSACCSLLRPRRHPKSPDSRRPHALHACFVRVPSTVPAVLARPFVLLAPASSPAAVQAALPRRPHLVLLDQYGGYEDCWSCLVHSCFHSLARTLVPLFSLSRPVGEIAVLGWSQAVSRRSIAPISAHLWTCCYPFSRSQQQTAPAVLSAASRCSYMSCGSGIGLPE